MKWLALLIPYISAIFGLYAFNNIWLAVGIYHILILIFLASSNKLDLEQHVKSILSNNKDSLLPLYSRYNNYFKPSGIASEIITNDICNKIYN